MQQESKFRFKGGGGVKGGVWGVLQESRGEEEGEGGQACIHQREGRRNILWHSPSLLLLNSRSEVWDQQQSLKRPSLLARACPPQPRWVRLCGRSRRHKVIARFGTKRSHSVKIGLRRRMKQEPGKNHFANRLPRRISLLKSSVQKFTP